MYLYYDKAFSGKYFDDGAVKAEQWIFDSVKPSMTPAVKFPFGVASIMACHDYDNTGECSYSALQLSANSMTVEENQVWKMDCGRTVEPNCQCSGFYTSGSGMYGGPRCNSFIGGKPFCFTNPGVCSDGVPQPQITSHWESSSIACATRRKLVAWDAVNLTISNANELSISSTNHVKKFVTINLTGFTNLAAFSWHNKATCPPGFYSTIDTPSDPYDVLCGKCPVGTEKLGPGGGLNLCLQCPKGKFDLDNDASTECERSKFRVETFEHYVPDKGETRYAFSAVSNDPLNNDPVRTPDTVEPNLHYFGPRTVNASTINSYQTAYADVAFLLPPFNLTSVKDGTSDKPTFTVDGTPDTFFINPSTGAIFAKPSLEDENNFTATIFAIDGDGGPRAEIESIHFTVVRKDIDVPTNGPGKKDCVHGKRVDGTRFDNQFTCNCTNSGFEDSNCSSSVAEKTKRLIISLVMGGTAFVVILSLVVYKFRQRRLAKLDAREALVRARKAYGIKIEPTEVRNLRAGLSVNSGDLVSVTTNPAFVGTDSDTDLLLLSPGPNGQQHIQQQKTQQPQQVSKFVAPIISLGKNTLAAKGLDVLLGVDPKTYMHVKNKVKVMVKEFAQNGTAEDNLNLSGMINGTYVNPPNKDGTPLTADEISGQSKSMAELMAYIDVQDAGLEWHHVLALRLYTTSTYKSINDPMRQKVLPHPFAATTYYISDALSKLREVQGKDPKRRNTSLTFWRGMKNLQIAEEFVRTGGTEMACMSTTSSPAVAQEFAESESPLLFKFVSKSFMSHGADISFLSVYPGEKEVLYPPLTYMRPIKLFQQTIGGRLYQIAEVEPVFPK